VGSVANNFTPSFSIARRTEARPLKRFFGMFVPQRDTELALETLERMRLKLDGLRFQREGKLVGIPLIRSPSAEEESILREKFVDYRIQETAFEPTVVRTRKLVDAVQGIVPQTLMPELPRSLDVVGDIAIVELSPKLDSYASAVGEGILQANPCVRLVLRKTGGVEGVFRTRGLKAIAGLGGTETLHREFGCKYRLDVLSTYFNPRLSSERRRVAGQVGKTEVIIDLFAGVGPYSILIAKLQSCSRVYALDINPSAIKYLKENALINQVADRVIPIEGDARESSKNLLSVGGDRVIMNLPSESERYLDVACRVLRPTGGYIHFYKFAPRGEKPETVGAGFANAIRAQNRKVEVFSYCDVVREVSPTRMQVAVDAFVK